jgi:hypothetical protein
MPSPAKPTTGTRIISTSGKNPISTSAMPAIDPSRPARGTWRCTAAPKNDNTNFRIPISTSAAMPSCQVAIAAACSSMPCCLNATNAGPSTSKAMPIVVGASTPSGIAVASLRPWRRAIQV